MTCFHLHADGSGETHLSPIEFPVRETYAGTVRGMTDVPVNTVGLAEFVGRKPDVGMHDAPRRAFLVILGGTLEVIASDGHGERLQAGDVLLADDVGSKGHISRDVGDDPLMMMSVAIGEDWDGP